MVYYTMLLLPALNADVEELKEGPLKPMVVTAAEDEDDDDEEQGLLLEKDELVLAAIAAAIAAAEAAIPSGWPFNSVSSASMVSLSTSHRSTRSDWSASHSSSLRVVIPTG